jgi:hypothetical protein
MTKLVLATALLAGTLLALAARVVVSLGKLGEDWNRQGRLF